MTASIRVALERRATRRVALAVLAAGGACMAGLAWRQDRLGDLELLDGRGWYTPAEVAALFDALDRLDAGARMVYAVTGLIIDMLFPVAARAARRRASSTFISARRDICVSLLAVDWIPTIRLPSHR